MDLQIFVNFNNFENINKRAERTEIMKGMSMQTQ